MVMANQECQDRIDSTFQWCLNHYGPGRGFVIPNIRVVSGADEAITEMKFSAEGKTRFEKVAIKHPL